MSDPPRPEDGPSWPERDLDRRADEQPPEPAAESGQTDDLSPPPVPDVGWDEPPASPAAWDPEPQPPFEPFEDAARPPELASEPAEPTSEPDDGQPTPEPQPPSEPEPPSEEPAPAPPTEAAEPTTAFDGSPDVWSPRLHGDRRRPTTAEQAVPWLIGIILALAGMVIVLLALIFTSPDGAVGGSPTPTPLASSAAPSAPPASASA
ncbi:MAG: hypothetical protein ACRDHD_12730, partial [Candidatus Limnocylindria bacterium]